MTRYYVNHNAQSNGDHEVHVRTCSFFPESVKDLGVHYNCHTAVVEAKKTYRQTNGCFYCCRECHTQ